MGAGRLGAEPGADRSCAFCVWAPAAERVEVVVEGDGDDRSELLAAGERGYHHGVLAGVGAGARYRYRLDGERELPDPASRSQPDGVHGASEVVDLGAFAWTDEHWFGRPLRDLVLYELHVGTFSEEGTFGGVIGELDRLAQLGVTAVELMPVAEFPGARNWGYDGAALFAPSSAYGGPDGLRALVDACHARGLCVVLDVVYNHFGPEGAYAGAFAPYFTDRHRTPWGDAINVDGAGSDEVRRFLCENALMWLDAYHVDGLRLDAVHGIVDTSARPFLAELAEAVAELGERRNRRLHLIAESDLNDPRLVSSRERGGFGLDAQWCDDFHHALHAFLTGERHGYYADYGSLADIGTAYRQGYVFTGQRSRFRGRRHGAPPDGVEPQRLVVYAQNHDQVGNRPRGERLAALVGFEDQKLAAGLVLLSPFLPLLFAGEEYGETRPFPYFVSHGDTALVEAVRRGRAEEFAEFFEAGEQPPDPQADATFVAARLDRARRDTPQAQALLALYRELLRLRRELPALGAGRRRADVECDVEHGLLRVRREAGHGQVLCLFHLGREPASVAVDAPDGEWRALLDSADERFGGPGRAWRRLGGEAVIAVEPRSFVVLSSRSG